MLPIGGASLPVLVDVMATDETAAGDVDEGNVDRDAAATADVRDVEEAERDAEDNADVNVDVVVAETAGIDADDVDESSMSDNEDTSFCCRTGGGYDEASVEVLEWSSG
jgi:rhodanese-related sulfurtransferase